MGPIEQRARGTAGRRVEVTMALWLLLGCTSTSTVNVTSDLGREDASMDDRARGSERCAADQDCDDGLFCNGAEQCDPSEPSADSHGCLGGRSPCMSTETCNEAMDRCVSSCDRTPDADHDGHDARECGGDDCDDRDPNRFPGVGREVCDPAQREHDEDCDPMTYANPATMDGDRDGDGAVDARCCNIDRNGNRECGPDCNDMDVGVRPGQSEACNGRDDNCNGMIDEGLTRREYCRDADGDGVGRRASGAMMACTPPAGYVLGCDDCDDANRGRNPGAPEVCDGVDNNCNGAADEGLPNVECCADADGDGYIAAGMRRTACGCSAGWRLCPPPMTPTDCCDGDARAHLGQTAFFDQPRRGCGGYDYDCDGTEREYCRWTQSQPGCEQSCHSLHATIPFSQPVCGAPATVYFGRWEGPNCRLNSGPVVQTARCR